MAAAQDLQSMCPEPAWFGDGIWSLSSLLVWLLGGLDATWLEQQNVYELYGGQEAASIAATVVTVQRRQRQVILWRLRWGFCGTRDVQTARDLPDWHQEVLMSHIQV